MALSTPSILSINISMGIFLDTVEDNRERNWQLEFDRSLISLRNRQNKPTSTVEICPECHRRFGSEKNLQDHIFDQHRDKSLIVSVDGISKLSNSNISHIDSSALSQALKEYDRLQNTFVMEESLDLDYLNQLVHQHTDEPLLAQYYKGITGYLEVAYSERNPRWIDKEKILKRLESAYGYLQPFDDDLSQQIRYAIAFRFDWFNMLGKAPKSSIFYLAYIFFNSTFEELENISIPIEAFSRRAFGVYMPQNLDSLLEMIVLFFEKSVSTDKLEKLREKTRLEQLNGGEVPRKFHLTYARTSRRTEHLEEARTSYKNLLYDNKYSVESKDYAYN